MINKPEAAPDNEGMDDLDPNTPIPIKRSTFSARFAVFLAALSLVFTIIGIGAGYRHWQRMDSKLQASQAQLAQLQQAALSTPKQTELARLQQTFDAQLQRYQADSEEKLQKMTELRNQAREFANTTALQVEQVTYLQARLQQGTPVNTQQDWQLAEVKFLLKLANRELYLANNKQSAISALKDAGRILAELGGINYLPAQQRISQDLAALENFQTPDISQLTHQLLSFTQSLPPIPFSGVQEKENLSFSNKQNPTENVSNWATYQQKIENWLDEIIIIHRYEQPIKTSLNLEARELAYELLKLRLENLQLFLLQQQQQNFQSQLQLVEDNIQRYYPREQAAALLEQLAPFKMVDLQPKVPNIANSLQLIRNAEKVTMP